MKRNILFLPILLLLPLVFSACATSGMFTSINSTNVELREPNYKIVATNVSGSSEAGYLLGLTFPNGPLTNTFACFRVSGTGLLYQEAIDNLWKNYEAANGSVQGKKLALINVRYDTDALNVLLLYTSAKVNIRADVVQFE